MSTLLFWTNYKLVEQQFEDSYSFVTKQYREKSDQTTETHEDRSDRVGKVILALDLRRRDSSPW